MKKFNEPTIEEKIGYVFLNKALLHQAFISPSVSVASNNKKENYQFLEFIGDAVLELAVVKNMTSDFCIVKTDGQFVSTKTLKELNIQKQENVKNTTLAHCAEVLTLNEFEEKDSNFSSKDSRNKKGDLIEAILGAVAIDCKWNFEVISSVVRKILLHKSIKRDYFELLENFCKKRNMFPIEYNFKNVTNKQGKPCVECFISIHNVSKVFRAKALEPLAAKNNACKNAHTYLQKAKKQNVNKEKNPICLLNNFYQTKKISKPCYKFNVTTEDKKILWECNVTIDECKKSFSNKASKKSIAKRTVAKALLDYYINKNSDKKIEPTKEQNTVCAKSNADKNMLVSLQQAEKDIAPKQNVINLLDTFCKTKNFSKPCYKFNEIKKGKKTFWKCNASIAECEYTFSNEASKKTIAKRAVAKALYNHLTKTYSDKKIQRGKGLLKLILSMNATD